MFSLSRRLFYIFAVITFWFRACRSSKAYFCKISVNMWICVRAPFRS